MSATIHPPIRKPAVLGPYCCPACGEPARVRRWTAVDLICDACCRIWTQVITHDEMGWGWEAVA